jgi:Zn-dependent protease
MIICGYCGKLLEEKDASRGKGGILICQECHEKGLTEPLPVHAQQPIAPPPQDPVEDIIAGIRRTDRNWLASLSILVVTILMFAAIGSFRDPISGVVILIGVLLVHELGHFASMKLFKYSDVQIFFVPMVGAAVTGNPTNHVQVNKPLVTLAGPLVGVLIGLGCSIGYWATHSAILRHAALMSAVLNLFNLIPLFPLDGGRFLFDVVFVRSIRAELAYRIVAFIGILVIAVAIRAFSLGIVGLFAVVSIPASVAAGRLAGTLKPMYKGRISGAIAQAPDDLLRSFINDVVVGSKPGTTVQYISRAKDVWERIQAEPPGAVAAIGLIAAYLVIVAMGGVIWILL